MLFQPINDLKKTAHCIHDGRFLFFVLISLHMVSVKKCLYQKKALWDQPQGFFNDICTKQFSQQRRNEHIYAPIAFSVSLTRSDASASVAAVEKRNPDSASI